MRLKHFLKRRNKNWIVLIGFLVVFWGNVQSQNLIKEGDIYIIEIDVLTINIRNNEWLADAFYYIVINDKVYSGDMFRGANFTCRVPEEFYLNNKEYFVPSTKVEKFVEKEFEVDSKEFMTGDSCIDRRFYWMCMKVRGSYLELPCHVAAFDVFEFMYDDNPNNGIFIIDIKDEKGTHTCLPFCFTYKIMQNIERIKKYIGYEDCMNKKKKE